MNRREALDILDRLHPDDVASSEAPEVRAAREAVAADPDLRRRWDRLAAFDRRASELVCEVEVPDDLHARLLGTLGLAETRPATNAEDVLSERVARRAWLRGALAASVVGAAGGLAWWWNGRTTLPAPTAFEYARRAAEQFESVRGLPPFAGGFAAHPPESWESLPIAVTPTPRALDLAREETRPVALYEFRIEREGQRFQGLLVAIPTEWLESPPAERYFDLATPSYVEPYAMVAWRENGLSYVCVADDETLRQLDRLHDIRPA